MQVNDESHKLSGGRRSVCVCCAKCAARRLISFLGGFLIRCRIGSQEFDMSV